MSIVGLFSRCIFVVGGFDVKITWLRSSILTCSSTKLRLSVYNSELKRTNMSKSLEYLFPPPPPSMKWKKCNDGGINRSHKARVPLLWSSMCQNALATWNNNVSGWWMHNKWNQGNVIDDGKRQLPIQTGAAEYGLRIYRTRRYICLIVCINWFGCGLSINLLPCGCS